MNAVLDPALPARGPGCPPVLALEAHASGETPGNAESLARHLTGCATCRGYVGALQEAGAAFLRARPTERFLRQLDAREAATSATSATAEAARTGDTVEGARGALGRRAPRPWLWGLGGLLTAAGLAALVVSVPRGAEAPGVTFKGSALSIYVRRGEAPPRPLSFDEPVLPNDALRFELRAPDDGYAVVFERDGSGAVAVVAPFGAQAPQQVQAGTNALEDSAVLDATPGPEHFVLVFSRTPFDVAAVKAQLQARSAQLGEGPGLPALPDALSFDCPGCTLHHVRFEKRQ